MFSVVKSSDFGNISFFSRYFKRQECDFGVTREGNCTTAKNMKRKLKVTISKVTRKTKKLIPAKLISHCARCDRETEILTKAQASQLLQTSENTLDDMVYAGVVHVIQMVNSNLWICKNSLFSRNPRMNQELGEE